MKIGWIGLGKLGLPCVSVILKKGFEVVGYDARSRGEALDSEDLYEPELDRSVLQDLQFAESIGEVVREADLIFIAVPTPHVEALDGTVPGTWDHPADFDYKCITEVTSEIVQELHATPIPAKKKVVCMVSTVCPGTMRRVIAPLISGVSSHMEMLYTPSFIAMGSTPTDYANPEFSLVGLENEAETYGLEVITSFYGSIHTAPVLPMTWTEAETAKMSYNTLIAFKIGFANTVMQVCHHIGDADCEVVMDALKRATKRLVSPMYLTPGMGDGGGCHPRDNLVLAWLSGQLGLRYNLFADIMRAREQQAAWIADMAAAIHTASKFLGPVWIMGKVYKPDTNLTAGSPSVLIGNLIENQSIPVRYYDPMLGQDQLPQCAAVVILGVNDRKFFAHNYQDGSVIIDPFRALRKVMQPEELDKVRVLELGNTRRPSS